MGPSGVPTGLCNNQHRRELPVAARELPVAVRDRLDEESLSGSAHRLIGFRPETDDGSPDIGHALSDQTERFAHVKHAKAMPHPEGDRSWHRRPHRSNPPQSRRAAH